MSESVDFDASKGVEQSAADFVLGVFWTYAVKPEISFREFKTLVEVWLKIREMEGPQTPEEPRHDYKQMYFDLLDKLIEQDVHPVPEPVTDFWENIPKEVQIDQHTFVSEKDAEAEAEALKARADKGSEAPKPGSWAKRELDRKFKQAVVERIREARKMGIGSEVIAQNCKGQGVTGDTVRQILQAQAVDVRKYRKVDEALDRLGVPKAQEETDEQKEE